MLEASRKRLGRQMVMTFNRLAEVISQYDAAYREMTSAQNPLAFKRFLLSSPGLFVHLGDTMGQLQHVVQFWRYRTRGVGSTPIPFEEYADLLRDFEDGMATRIG